MNERKEITWIHIVRVLACLMVVCIHVSTASKAYLLTHLDVSFNHLVRLVCLPCVPLFMMVTGFLILPYKNGDEFMAFYRKRIPRVWFPLLVWGGVYAILPFVLGMVGWHDMVKEVLLSPIKQPNYFGGILWYLYVLIGIYLFIPFLTERIYRNKSHLCIYILVWLMSSVALLIEKHISNVFGENPWEQSFDMFLYFSGYLGFLLLGCWIKLYGEPIKKLYKIRIRGGEN